MRKSLTEKEAEDRKRYIRIFYNVLGMSINDIAKHYELAPSVVEGMVIYVPRWSTHKHLKDKMPEIFDKWVNGKSHRTLAREYNTTKHGIQESLSGYGNEFEPERYRQALKQSRGQKKE